MSSLETPPPPVWADRTTAEELLAEAERQQARIDVFKREVDTVLRFQQRVKTVAALAAGQTVRTDVTIHEAVFASGTLRDRIGLSRQEKKLVDTGWSLDHFGTKVIPAADPVLFVSKSGRLGILGPVVNISKAISNERDLTYSDDAHFLKAGSHEPYSMERVRNRVNHFVDAHGLAGTGSSDDPV